MRSNKVRTNVYFEPTLKESIEEFCRAESLSLTRFCEAVMAHVIEVINMQKKCKKGKKK